MSSCVDELCANQKSLKELRSKGPLNSGKKRQARSEASTAKARSKTQPPSQRTSCDSRPEMRSRRETEPEQLETARKHRAGASSMPVIGNSRATSPAVTVARAAVKLKAIPKGDRPARQVKAQTLPSGVAGDADESAYVLLGEARTAHRAKSTSKKKFTTPLAASEPVAGSRSKSVNFGRLSSSFSTCSAVSPSMMRASQKIPPFPESCNKEWQKTIDEFLQVLNSENWVPEDLVPNCHSYTIRDDKSIYVKSVATVDASIQHILAELQDPEKFHSLWSQIDSTFVRDASKGYLDIECINDAFGGQKRGGGVCHAQFRVPGMLTSKNFVWAEISGVLANGDAVIVRKDTKHPSARLSWKRRQSLLNNLGSVGLSGYLLQKSLTSDATEVHYLGQVQAIRWIEKMTVNRRVARHAERAERIKDTINKDLADSFEYLKNAIVQKSSRNTVISPVSV